MWSGSSSAGGLVWGVTVSRPCRGPIVKASCTSSQPPGVCQVVLITFVPGTYVRAVGTLIAYGQSGTEPAPRSSRLPNVLGASNAGRQSQSTDPSGATRAPV